MAPNGWQEWSKFVLKELTRLSDTYEDLSKKVNEEVTQLKTEVAMLQVKSGIWGIIGGAIVIIVVLLSRTKLFGG